jgi:uncharacterized membrane protein (DUF485 family)
MTNRIVQKIRARANFKDCRRKKQLTKNLALKELKLYFRRLSVQELKNKKNN